MKYDSEGYIQINAFTAAGALPAAGVNVRITGSDEENLDYDYTVVTGRDGSSGVISAPAPSAYYSEAPAPAEQPYARYNVEAFGDGYYPKTLRDVSVFSGIKSFIPLEMIPNLGIIRNSPPPTSSNDSIITENEDL